MISVEDLEYIVFDWDNTLADTSEQMKNLMDQTVKVLLNKGAHIKINLEWGYWNKSLDELMHFESKKLLAEGKIIYNKFMSESTDHNIKVFEGATSLLTFLKSKGKRLFVISNKEETLLHKQIKNCNLWSYFEKVSGPCPISGISKPSAKVFSNTIGSDILPKVVLLIGDSRIDEETAKNFDCRFMYVNNQKFNTFHSLEGQPTDLNGLLSYFRNSHIDI